MAGKVGFKVLLCVYYNGCQWVALNLNSAGSYIDSPSVRARIGNNSFELIERMLVDGASRVRTLLG